MKNWKEWLKVVMVQVSVIGIILGAFFGCQLVEMREDKIVSYVFFTALSLATLILVSALLILIVFSIELPILGLFGINLLFAGFLTLSTFAIRNSCTTFLSPDSFLLLLSSIFCGGSFIVFNVLSITNIYELSRRWTITSYLAEGGFIFLSIFFSLQ